MARTLNAPTEYEQRLIDRYNERLAISLDPNTPYGCFLCGATNKRLTLAAVPGPADTTMGTTNPSPVCNRAQSLCRPCKRQNVPYGWQEGVCVECGQGGQVRDDRFDGAKAAHLVCGSCLNVRNGRDHNCY
jgi:hypothetical protein